MKGLYVSEGFENCLVICPSEVNCGELRTELKNNTGIKTVVVMTLEENLEVEVGNSRINNICKAIKALTSDDREIKAFLIEDAINPDSLPIWKKKIGLYQIPIADSI